MISQRDNQDQEKQADADGGGRFHPESLVIGLILAATVISGLVRLFA